MKFSATIANSLWVASSLPAWRRFRAALDSPEVAQAGWLREHLARNSSCEFARRYNLSSASTYQEFSQQVPLSNHEQMEPWIVRIRSGEKNLLVREPVTHLIPTSGSTGARKLIPFTAGLQQDFNRAIGPWICDLARQYPAILGGPAYWSITPTARAENLEPSQVPIGFADDASYLGGARQWLMQAALVGPDKLSSDANADEFRFQTLLCLVRQRELRLISGLAPLVSFIVARRLARLLEAVA